MILFSGYYKYECVRGMVKFRSSSNQEQVKDSRVHITSTEATFALHKLQFILRVPQRLKKTWLITSFESSYNLRLTREPKKKQEAFFQVFGVEA